MTFKVFASEFSIDNLIAHGPVSEGAYPDRFLRETHFDNVWTEQAHICHKLDRLVRVAFALCQKLKKDKEETLSQRLNFEASASTANYYNVLVSNAEIKLQEERMKKLAADALYQKLKSENAEMLSLQSEAGNLRQGLVTAETFLKSLEIKNQEKKAAVQVLENSMQTLEENLAQIDLKHKIAKDELAVYEESLNAKFEKLKLALEKREKLETDIEQLRNRILVTTIGNAAEIEKRNADIRTNETLKINALLLSFAAGS